MPATKSYRFLVADHEPTVEDLLAHPGLRLRVLAGEAGVRRTVSWAHASELRDPTPWLLGSELIMTTGIAVPRSAAGQRAYLERLDDAGVSALALSAGLEVPPLRRAFLRAADARAIPLLEVPLAVPFIAVAREVAAAVQEDARRRLGAQLQVFGALRWLVSEDLDTATLFRRLERLSGYRLHLCTPRGRPLLPGVSAPPDPAVLPASLDAAPTVPGGLALPVLGPGGPAGFLVAFERPGIRPAGLAVAQHIATVAALRLVMVRHERETLRREGAETLAELLQEVLDPAAAERRLRRLSIVGESVLLVVRGVPDAELSLALDDLPHLLLNRGGDSYLLGSPEVAEVVAALPGAAAGMSRPFPAGEPLRTARGEALWAVARAVESGRPLVGYDDGTTTRWLPQDPAVLTALVEHVLGAVLAYDRAHDSRLLASVRTWMERDRRVDAAAAALRVHPNTLAYRLRRFAELSGRDLYSTEAFAEVWLAVGAAGRLGLAEPLGTGE